MQFKVGDKVIRESGEEWAYSKYLKVKEVALVLEDGGQKEYGIFRESRLKLYEEPKINFDKLLEKVEEQKGFKVGDKVVKSYQSDWIVMDGKLDFVRIKTVEEDVKGLKYTLDSDIVGVWRDRELKLYKEKIEEKENKTMEKTFKEVIEETKDGAIWSNGEITIICNGNFINIENKNESGRFGFAFGTDKEFTLQRKKVTFTEAFKTKGNNIIESCESGSSYCEDENAFWVKYKGHIEYSAAKEIPVSEIEGMWIIYEN